jgi:hypothetical protein
MGASKGAAKDRGMFSAAIQAAIQGWGMPLRTLEMLAIDSNDLIQKALLHSGQGHQKSDDNQS